MLKRAHRLPPVIRFSHARIFRTPFMTIKYQNAKERYSRAGIVISKRVSSKATERNRYKRVLVTLLAPLLTASSSPQDILIIVHPAITTLTPEDLREQAVAAFQKMII